MNANGCVEMNRHGQPCNARPLRASQYCFFHAPDKARERTSARRSGGIERSRQRLVFPPETPDRALRTRRELANLLEETTNRLLKGQLDVKIATVAGQLVGIMERLLHGSALEQTETLREILSLQVGQHDNIEISNRELFVFSPTGTDSAEN
jgi:hypothetical protein